MNFRSFAITIAALAAPVAAQFNVCSSSLLGTGCGPTLDVTFTPVGNAGNQQITISGGGLDPAGITVMVWGLNNLGGFPLPLGGCPVYTEYLWGHNINPDAAGFYSWSRSWPNSVQGQYNIQLGTLYVNANNEFAIETSEARVAICTQ
ncbi:MAG: hypothetical protein ACE37K_16885 [Planctomycetota bacterium]